METLINRKHSPVEAGSARGMVRPASHSRRASGSLPVTPLAALFAVVLATNLFSAPVGLLLNPEDFNDIEFGVTQDQVWYAYYWTLYACAFLAVLYFGLGIHRIVAEYQKRTFVSYGPEGFDRFWTITFVIGMFLAAVLFVQAGFRVPLLDVIGRDYQAYEKLRSYYDERINGTLFNISLFWIATSNLTIAWLHGSSVARKLASAALFAVIGCFTLARSPVGFALLMVIAYRLLWHRISWRDLFVGLGVMFGLLLATHYLTGEPTGYHGMGEYLWVRVFYGQWASLPYYFALFEHNPLAWSSMLGPAAQSVLGGGSAVPEGAARMVMEVMCPDGVYAGTAGVSSAFFVGDAYAVAGIGGVVLAPLFVMLQVLVIALCFRRLEKTTLNMFLYSWFLYKVFTGVIAGFSQFVASFLQVMILALIYYAMVTGLLARLARGVRRRVA